MIKDLLETYKRSDVFIKMICVYVLLSVVSMILMSSVVNIDVVSYFCLPTNFSEFLAKPWTIITYSFFHFNIVHLLINAVILYFFSRYLINLFRIKMLLNIYFLGIIFSGVAFLIVYNLFPLNTNIKQFPLSGASGGIRALIIFLCASVPNSEMRSLAFRIRWKYIGIALVVIDILGLYGTNFGANIAHLGGTLFGFIYALQLKKGNDIGSGFERLMDTISGWFSSSKPLKTVHRSSKKNRYAGKTKTEFNTFSTQKKIDLILDKISKSGYESLTEAEKEFLFRAGK